MTILCVLTDFNCRADDKRVVAGTLQYCCIVNGWQTDGRQYEKKKNKHSPAIVERRRDGRRVTTLCGNVSHETKFKKKKNMYKIKQKNRKPVFVSLSMGKGIAGEDVCLCRTINNR